MNRDCKHFYDCWDVATLTTTVGLLCLLDEIAKEQSLDLETIDEVTFIKLVNEIYSRINLMGRWSGQPSWGTDQFSNDELLMFSLGQHQNPQITNIHVLSLDQLNYGVRLLAEKHATNYGDCEALVSFIRDSIGEYHLQGKVLDCKMHNFA